MADWQKTTWDGIQPGNVVDIDGRVGQVRMKTKTNEGMFVFTKEFGPVKVTADQEIEVFK